MSASPGRNTLARAQDQHGSTDGSSRPLRACLLAYTFYEIDGQVIRYAEALAESGATVDVIALGRENQPKTRPSTAST